MSKVISSNDYFDLYEVRKNVYAAIKNNDLCMSNAGFINLGDRVLVFDTFVSVKAAKLLRELIVDVTGINKFIVINSHGHVDHIVGNCIFDDSIIIASRKSYESLMAYKDEIKFGEEIYRDEIKRLKDNLKKLEDFDEILNTKNNLVIYENLSNNEGRLVLPNLTFNDSLTLRGPLGSVNLISIDKAHSSGDVICTLDDKEIAFVGDLLFVDQHTYIGQGDPMLFIEELERLLDSNIEYFIPGHGPICRKDKVEEEIEYIKSIVSLVKNNMERADDLKPEDLPSRFKNYGGVCFRWNIDFLKEYLKSK